MDVINKYKPVCKMPGNVVKSVCKMPRCVYNSGLKQTPTPLNQRGI